MQRATLDELAADPVGRYVAGEAYAHFCAAPTLWGVILWGRPDERAALTLGRSLILELAPPARPHASIIDASRLEGGDPTAFAATERYLTHFEAKLREWVLRLALVRPGGLGGALVAGAYEVMPRPYPVEVFTDATAAMTWLAQGDDSWPDGAALIAAIHGEVTGTSPVVGALRRFLDGHLADVELRDAARALAISERSLQRKLGEADTSFVDELSEARVRAGRRLLLDGDAPLTTIAFDVGCASLQAFSALFRRRTGESPSAFRARHRRGTS